MFLGAEPRFRGFALRLFRLLAGRPFGGFAGSRLLFRANSLLQLFQRLLRFNFLALQFLRQASNPLFRCGHFLLGFGPRRLRRLCARRLLGLLSLQTVSFLQRLGLRGFPGLGHLALLGPQGDFQLFAAFFDFRRLLLRLGTGFPFRFRALLVLPLHLLAAFSLGLQLLFRLETRHAGFFLPPGQLRFQIGPPFFRHPNFQLGRLAGLPLGGFPLLQLRLGCGALFGSLLGLTFRFLACHPRRFFTPGQLDFHFFNLGRRLLGLLLKCGPGGFRGGIPLAHFLLDPRAAVRFLANPLFQFFAGLLGFFFPAGQFFFQLAQLGGRSLGALLHFRPGPLFRLFPRLPFGFHLRPPLSLFGLFLAHLDGCLLGFLLAPRQLLFQFAQALTGHPDFRLNGLTRRLFRLPLGLPLLGHLRLAGEFFLHPTLGFFPRRFRGGFQGLQVLLQHESPRLGFTHFMFGFFASLTVGLLVQAHGLFPGNPHFHFALLKFFFQFALLFLGLFARQSLFLFAGPMFFTLALAAGGFLLQERFKLFAFFTRLLDFGLKFNFELLAVFFNFGGLLFGFFPRQPFLFLTGLPLGLHLRALLGLFACALFRLFLGGLGGFGLPLQFLFQLPAARLGILHPLLGGFTRRAFGLFAHLEVGFGLRPFGGRFRGALFGSLLGLLRFFFAPAEFLFQLAAQFFGFQGPLFGFFASQPFRFLTGLPFGFHLRLALGFGLGLPFGFLPRQPGFFFAAIQFLFKQAAPFFGLADLLFNPQPCLPFRLLAGFQFRLFLSAPRGFLGGLLLGGRLRLTHLLFPLAQFGFELTAFFFRFAHLLLGGGARLPFSLFTRLLFRFLAGADFGLFLRPFGGGLARLAHIGFELP